MIASRNVELLNEFIKYTEKDLKKLWNNDNITEEEADKIFKNYQFYISFYTDFLTNVQKFEFNENWSKFVDYYNNNKFLDKYNVKETINTYRTMILKNYELCCKLLPDFEKLANAELIIMRRMFSKDKTKQTTKNKTANREEEKEL